MGDRCGGAFRHQLDPSYHGLVYARDLGVNGDFGVNRSFVHKARVQLLRDLGSAVTPSCNLRILSPSKKKSQEDVWGQPCLKRA